MNLFGEDFDVQEQENACAATASKPSKPKAKSKKENKNSTNSANTNKLAETKLPNRNIRVKMYSDFYEYNAPDDVAEPTLEDVRIFMINQHGFTELIDEKRAGLMIVEPPDGEPYVYCGVKFEKMG